MASNDFAMGVVLCFSALIASNTSKIFLKLLGKAEQALAIAEQHNFSIDASLNKYFVASTAFYLLGLSCDVFAQTLLNSVTWATVSSYDVVFFHAFNAYWFHDTLEVTRAAIVTSFFSGSLLVTFANAQVDDSGSDLDAFTNAWSSNLVEQIIFWTSTFVTLCACWTYILRFRQNTNEDSTPNVTERESQIAKFVVALATGISFGMMGFFMFILANTAFRSDDAPFSRLQAFIALFIFGMCFFFQLFTNWVAVEMTNVKSDVTSTIMVSTLFQISASASLWSIEFEGNSIILLSMWYVGLIVQIVSLLIWLTLDLFVQTEEEADKKTHIQSSMPVVESMLSLNTSSSDSMTV